jgi:hypothetical protein
MRFWVPFKRQLRRKFQEHAAMSLAVLLSKLRFNGDNEDDINNFELRVRVHENNLPTPRPIFIRNVYVLKMEYG